jgi:hypothetical protein
MAGKALDSKTEVNDALIQFREKRKMANRVTAIRFEKKQVFLLRTLLWFR